MKKSVIIVVMLVLCTVASYASVGYESVVKFNDRILELKLDLQKQLLMKKYNNQVIGSFEVKGDTVLLKAYSIPDAGQQSFTISEVRNAQTFDIVSTAATLPETAMKDSKAGVQESIVKGIALAGLLLLMATVGLFARGRKTTKARKSVKTEERKEEKERLAA